MLMAAITPAEAEAYFKRWELVKELELIELRHLLPPTTRGVIHVDDRGCVSQSPFNSRA